MLFSKDLPPAEGYLFDIVSILESAFTFAISAEIKAVWHRHCQKREDRF